MIQKGALGLKQMDQGCRGRGPCLCLAATPTQLITLLFIPNNVVAVSGGWRRALALLHQEKQAGTLKRASEQASGFKRYSLSFLMEKNRKWGCEAGFCDLYAAVAGGEKSKSISLSAPLVCSPILPNIIPASPQHHKNTLVLVPPGKQRRICLRRTLTS